MLKPKYTLLLYIVLMTWAPAWATTSETINLQLKWKHSFQFAGIYMAIEQGFYQQQGLHIQLIENQANSDPVDFVLSAPNTFAISGSSALLAYEQGKDIATIASIFQYSPLVLITKQSSHINSFADLKGKRVMIQPGFGNLAIIAALAKAGLYEGDYIRQNISFDLQDLIQGRTDAFSAYTTGQLLQAKNLGVKLNILNPKSQGIDFYGDTIITSKHEALHHPELIRAFVHATQQGWNYALSHIDEAVDVIIQKYNSQHLSKAHYLQEAQASIPYIRHDLVPVGFINKEKWGNILHVLKELKLVQQERKLDNFIFEPETTQSIGAILYTYKWQALLVFLLLMVAMTLFIIITLRKVIQEKSLAIEQQHQIYKTMIESAPEPIAIHADGVWKYTNPATLKLFAANSEKDLIGKPVWDFIHPSFHSIAKERIKQATISGKTPVIEEKLLRLDGSSVWAEVTSLGITYEGKPATLAMAKDISAQKNKEEQSAFRNRISQNLRHTLEQLNRAETLDEAYDIALSGIKAVLGCDRASILRFGDDDKAHFVAAVGISQAYQQAVDGHSPWEKNEKEATPIFIPSIQNENLEETLKQTILDEGIAASGFFPLTASQGVIGKYIAYFNQEQNLTDEQINFGEILANDLVATILRIEIQEKKVALIQQVAHTQRLESLGVLAGGIAHDFNNLLAIIMGNTALVTQKITMPEPHISKYLHNIMSSSEKAAALCQQMLAYSGQGKLENKTLSLNNIIQSISTLLQTSIAKQTTLSFDLAQDLPLCQGDEAQLQQVIMNLIINASESLNQTVGTVSIKTEVQTLSQQDIEALSVHQHVKPGLYIHLKISDTGCGMSQTTLNKIFDPFYTTKFQGRGLGMSAVLGIIQSHHCGMHIESEEGKGSTFHVYFPALDNTHSISDKTSPSTTEPDIHIQGQVLIVDDESGIREFVACLLDELNIIHLEAESGEDAIQLYHQHSSDIEIIILDLTMPKMDGVTCFHKIKSINPDVSVIIASGYAESEVAKHFATLKPEAFLQKPFQPEALTQLLADITTSTNTNHT